MNISPSRTCVWIGHEDWPRGSMRILITVCFSQPFGATHTIPPPPRLWPNLLCHPPVPHSQLANRAISNHQRGGDAYTSDKEWHIVTLSPASFCLKTWPRFSLVVKHQVPGKELLSGCPTPYPPLRDPASSLSNLYPTSIFLESYAVWTLRKSQRIGSTDCQG